MNIGRFIVASALAASTLVASSSFANPPHLPDMVSGGNRWQLSGFDDSSNAHTPGAVQTLCFFNAGTVGTQQRYRWVSTTFGAWDGLATQEGDQVFMHGDFTFIGQPNVGHDSLDFELTAPGEASGHWKEWLENDGSGLTIIWNNAKLVRTGKCLQRNVAEVLESTRSRPNLDPAGVPILTPSGVDPAQVPETLEVDSR